MTFLPEADLPSHHPKAGNLTSIDVIACLPTRRKPLLSLSVRPGERSLRPGAAGSSSRPFQDAFLVNRPVDARAGILVEATSGVDET